MPAISRDGHRLAYTTQIVRNINIWQVPLAAPTRSSAPPMKLISSSRTQYHPAFSPDGRRLAFESTRSGNSEIWTSGPDGSDAVAVTAFGGPWTGSPKWSPNAQFIAFDSRAEGRSNIYLVRAEGGPPRRVATGVDDSSQPEWSSDGKWLYFDAKFRGIDEIFKVRLEGGAPTRLTLHGGSRPLLSRSDSTQIYYTGGEGMICSVSTTGGDERCLSALPRLRPEFSDAWTLSQTGIYFINGALPRPGIDFFDFRRAVVVRVTDLPGRPVPFGTNPALSPDGARLLYAQLDGIASDIMLVDKMR
jgi:Tol biopolymer transport system component